MPRMEGTRKGRSERPAGNIPILRPVQLDVDSPTQGNLVFDRRFPLDLPVHNHIYPRQNGDDSTQSEGARTTAQKQLRFSTTATASAAAETFTSAILPGSSSRSSGQSSPTSSAEPTSIVTAPGSASSLPRPFDTGLGNNYTQPNCPVFINSFLRNETFTSCLPFSLLLQNSMSFFSVTKSIPTITTTLDATCNVPDEPACNTLMSSIASDLRSEDTCASDYTRQQPLVIAAYNALVSYEPLYRAGCERDNEGNYCFANAITNRTSPTDAYPYYLPLGIGLPGGSQPTCSTCLQRAMGIFQEAGGKKSGQVLQETYPAAASMVNQACGPGFVESTIENARTAGQNSGAAGALSLTATSTKTIALLVGVVLAVGML
ncbi:MAG: hypothetical protein Q9174_004300 [Haloplaca sp. 1 TL-2023]